MPYGFRKYEVEELVDVKETEIGKYYLVKWLNYPHSQNSWEPESSVKRLKEMIRDVEQKKAAKQPEVQVEECDNKSKAKRSTDAEEVFLNKIYKRKGKLIGEVILNGHKRLRYVSFKPIPEKEEKFLWKCIEKVGLN